VVRSGLGISGSQRRSKAASRARGGRRPPRGQAVRIPPIDPIVATRSAGEAIAFGRPRGPPEARKKGSERLDGSGQASYGGPCHEGGRRPEQMAMAATSDSPPVPASPRLLPRPPGRTWGDLVGLVSSEIRGLNPRPTGCLGGISTYLAGRGCGRTIASTLPARRSVRRVPAGCGAAPGRDGPRNLDAGARRSVRIDRRVALELRRPRQPKPGRLFLRPGRRISPDPGRRCRTAGGPRSRPRPRRWPG
jgi:hypothetical protein